MRATSWRWNFRSFPTASTPKVCTICTIEDPCRLATISYILCPLTNRLARWPMCTPQPDVARGRIAARIGRLFSSTPPDRPGACTGITDPIALYGDGYRLTPDRYSKFCG